MASTGVETSSVSTADLAAFTRQLGAMLDAGRLSLIVRAGALRTLLADQGLTDHPLFAQAKGRGIRSLAGHIETTDLTNDVNGGPSGVGIASMVSIRRHAMSWFCAT